MRITVQVECMNDDHDLEEMQSCECREGRIFVDQITGYYKDSKGGSYIQTKHGSEWHVKEAIEEIDMLTSEAQGGLMNFPASTSSIRLS